MIDLFFNRFMCNDRIPLILKIPFFPFVVFGAFLFWILASLFIPRWYNYVWFDFNSSEYADWGYRRRKIDGKIEIYYHDQIANTYKKVYPK